MTNFDQAICTLVQDEMVQRFLDKQGLQNAMPVASKNLKLSPFVDLEWDVYSPNFMEHYGTWKMSGRLVGGEFSQTIT